MKKFFFLFIITLGLSKYASAQWTQQVSGTTHTLEEIFFPAVDTGFVVGDSGTVLHTINGGNLWSAQNPDTTKHLTDVFFLNTQKGFVVGDSGYFASTTNGGASWSGQYITQNNVLELNSVFFTTPLIGYVGGLDDLSNGIILKTGAPGCLLLRILQHVELILMN